MKSLYHNIILSILLLVIAAGADYAYPEEIEKQPALTLSDSETGFPVLKRLFDSGFFSANNFTVQYIPAHDAGSIKNSAASDVTLTSSLTIIGGAEYTSFRLFMADPLNQNIMIGWEVPANDKYRRDSSLRSMIGFAKDVRESTVPDALVEYFGRSSAIRDMSAMYKDEDGTEVSGYDLTVHAGFTRTHRFVRTIGELCLINSLGVANYWINRDANMEDWRYRYRRKDIWPRFRDGWTWDTNAFRTNALYHIYSGSIYYQTGRSNEYGVLASTAWAFTGSLIWEYLGEWREQTSANDMIFTTFGGALVGEAFHQYSLYIEQTLPHSVYGRIFSFLLDPMRIINRALDRWLDGEYKVSIVFVNPAAQVIMGKSRKN